MKTALPSSPTTVQVTINWPKLASVAVACIGLVVSFNLAWSTLNHAQNLCPIGSGMDCELVVRSVYSRIGPVPVAYLGLIGYLLILAVLLFETRLPSGKIVVFGLTLLGFLFSGYLTATEAFVLHTWCQPCVISALAMTCLVILSLIRLWGAISAVPADEEMDMATDAYPGNSQDQQ